MRNYEDGLSAVRYPRDNVSEQLLGQPCPAFELGRARCLTPVLDVCERQDGRGTNAAPDAVVLAYGTPAIDALKAANELAASGYSVAVYDARFAKPIDTGLLRAILERGIPLVTVEDHSVVGGFGACVLEAAQAMGLDCSRMIRLGLPDAWIMQDSRSKQLAEAGIDAPGIARAVRAAAELRPRTTAPEVRVPGAERVAAR
jgi:1-deoxy-D-xylulose-5-phosphate synthase